MPRRLHSKKKETGLSSTKRVFLSNGRLSKTKEEKGRVEFSFKKDGYRGQEIQSRRQNFRWAGEGDQY